MNPTTKSLIAATAVLATSGAILLGAVMRDGVDVGGANSPEPVPTSGLVASRSKSEVPEGDYFYEITNLLKQRYVERVGDEQKLALGAVRGMVASLGDPDSLYLDKDQFAVHQAMRAGRYEGIGAQLELVYLEPRDKDARGSGQPVDPEEALLGSIRIPKLTVVSIVPGGPSDKAGVKVGDYVEYVDGHWVPNSETVASFRKLQKAFSESKVSWAEISKVRLELTKRMKKTLLPLKAREKLLVGKSGTVEVIWKREKESLKTSILKSPSQMPEFSDVDGVITLRFTKGVDDQLRKAIEGKSSLVIDLRNNANGLPAPMQSCLELLVPKGIYGKLIVGKRETPFEVKKGTTESRSITLLVDRSTRGVAEVFANALVASGVAKQSGPATAGHPILVEDFPLPEGAGYSLAVANYKGGAK
ncbi:MAG: hypothetical protein H7Y17_01435 [Chlorobia bacterium]|nr:hypothetical protein [Fimbriimonadaceae bacterium]